MGGAELVYESHMHEAVVCGSPFSRIKTKLELPVIAHCVPVEDRLTCCALFSEKEGQ